MLITKREAVDQAPAARLISICGRAIAAASADPVPQATIVLAGLCNALPEATDRGAALPALIRSSGEPLDRLCPVLPFNVH